MRLPASRLPPLRALVRTTLPLTALAGAVLLGGFSSALAAPAQLDRSFERRVQFLAVGPKGLECVGDEELCAAVSAGLGAPRAPGPEERAADAEPEEDAAVPAVAAAEQVPAGTVVSELPPPPELERIELAAVSAQAGVPAAVSPIVPIAIPATAEAAPSTGRVLIRCKRSPVRTAATGETSYTLDCTELPLGENEVVYLGQPGGPPTELTLARR